MKTFGAILAVAGSVLLFQPIATSSAVAGTTMSPAKVIFPKLNLLLVHCCHAHPVHPYDSYCCHPPGAYAARAAVGAAVGYGVYRGVKHAHKKHHKKYHTRPARRRR